MKKQKHTGKFLGVPYDFRMPTHERIRERVWNPKDRHVFTPKVFGWGWTINFHELFRRVGIIRKK